MLCLVSQLSKLYQIFQVISRCTDTMNKQQLDFAHKPKAKAIQLVAESSQIAFFSRSQGFLRQAKERRGYCLLFPCKIPPMVNSLTSVSSIRLYEYSRIVDHSNLDPYRSTLFVQSCWGFCFLATTLNRPQYRSGVIQILALCPCYYETGNQLSSRFSQKRSFSAKLRP